MTAKRRSLTMFLPHQSRERPKSWLNLPWYKKENLRNNQNLVMMKRRILPHHPLRAKSSNQQLKLFLPKGNLPSKWR
jgi:hypothetical protein